MIGSVELNKLTAFLNTGGALYIEGNDFARDHKDTDFFNLLGCGYVDDGGNWFRGKIFSLEGQADTFTRGSNLNYLDEIEPNQSADIIEAKDGELIFASQDGKGRAVAYNNESEGYRVIVSSFVFGAIVDEKKPNTKKEIMKRYMKFLVSGK